MKPLALAAIRGYQRFLSPLKGFACAHRVVHGGPGCSEFGYRAIRRFGVVGGLRVLNIRLALCTECHAECRVDHSAPGIGLSRHRALQRGSCDLPCDLPCDGVCDALECADCDWPRRRQQERRPTRAEREAARRRIREQRRQQLP